MPINVDIDSAMEKAIEAIESHEAKTAAEKPAPAAPVTPAAPAEATAEPSAGELAGKETTAPVHNWEKRYNDLQSDIDRRINNATKGLSAQLSQMQDLFAKTFGQQKPSTQSDEEVPDLSNPDQLARLVERVANEVVARSVPQYLANDPIRNEYGMRLAVNQLSVKYPDFDAYKPQIAKVMEGLPDAPVNAQSFEQVYLTLKAHEAVQQRPVEQQAAAPSASQPIATAAAKGLSAEERARLQAKSQQLANPSGVPVGSEMKKSGRVSLDERIDSAIDEYYSQRR